MRALRGAHRRRIGCVLLLGVLFAIATEAAQGLLPLGRAPSIFDALADAAGILLGLGLFYGQQRLRKRGTPILPDG